MAGQKALEVTGVQKLSLRELSRDLGVSHTAPLRHFADKQALLDALALDGWQKLEASLNGATGRDVTERFTSVGVTYVRFAREHPVLLELMGVAKQRSDVPQELLDAANRARASGPRIIAKAQARGEIIEGDPEQLSLVLYGCIHGLVSMAHQEHCKSHPLEDIVRFAVSHVMTGLRPR